RAAQRIAERRRGALEGGLHARRQADLTLHGLDRVHGMTERVARREIERNGDRGKLADMVDREWSGARAELRDGRERDLRAARRSDVDVLQRVRTAAELGLHLEYHAILRRLGVDRRDQALPESVVERGIDGRGRDAQAPGAGPVDVHVCTPPLALPV